MDIGEAMQAWRDGLLSESECLAALARAMTEVSTSLHYKEKQIIDRKALPCIYGRYDVNKG